MFSLLAGLLAFFYELIPNYAVAISLLTITVLGVLTPLTWKGTRSMLQMQKLQPEMKRIQEMHKGDRQAQNEAMMEFYKEHKLNPLGGCLPMLAQFPVMIVMFRVLHGLAKHKTVNGVRVGNPDYLSKSSELYQALKASGGKMVSFGVDFGAKPTEAGRGAAVLFVLIALVVITGFWQVRQMTSRTTQVNPQMQVMNRITPFMSGFFSLQLPGGVTVYFLISNLFRVTQQSLMYRFDPHLSAHMEDVREIKTRAATQPPQPKKGLMASLREQAEAREANRGRGNPSNGNGNAPKSNGTSGPKPSASGRVTQPGQRGNAPRKRNKKRR